MESGKEKAISALGNEGNVWKLVTQYIEATNADKSVIEKALLTAIDVAKKKNNWHSVSGCLNHKLSDSVKIKAIETCVESGNIKSITDFLSKETAGSQISDFVGGFFGKKPEESVMKRGEQALLHGIDICERKDWADQIVGLFYVEGLSKAVKEKARSTLERMKTKGSATSEQVMEAYEGK